MACRLKRLVRRGSGGEKLILVLQNAALSRKGRIEREGSLAGKEGKESRAMAMVMARVWEAKRKGRRRRSWLTGSTQARWMDDFFRSGWVHRWMTGWMDGCMDFASQHLGEMQ